MRRIEKLYHYQDFNEAHLKDALAGKIYFSNPKNSNDPWDCNPWFDNERLGEPAYRAKCIEFYEQFHLSYAQAEVRARRVMR